MEPVRRPVLVDIDFNDHDAIACVIADYERVVNQRNQLLHFYKVS